MSRRMLVVMALIAGLMPGIEVVKATAPTPPDCLVVWPVSECTIMASTRSGVVGGYLAEHMGDSLNSELGATLTGPGLDRQYAAGQDVQDFVLLQPGEVYTLTLNWPGSLGLVSSVDVAALSMASEGETGSIAIGYEKGENGPQDNPGCDMRPTGDRRPGTTEYSFGANTYCTYAQYAYARAELTVDGEVHDDDDDACSPCGILYGNVGAEANGTFSCSDCAGASVKVKSTHIVRLGGQGVWILYDQANCYGSDRVAGGLLPRTLTCHYEETIA